VKTYPKGTKWAVKAYEGTSVRWCTAGRPTIRVFDGDQRGLWDFREEALSDVRRWRLVGMDREITYRLVVILPRVDHKAEAERLRAAAIAAAEILRRVQTGHAYGVPCGIWTLSDRKAIADAHDLLSAVLTPPDPAWKAAE
jgi:hypothetical protein